VSLIKLKVLYPGICFFRGSVWFNRFNEIGCIGALLVAEKRRDSTCRCGNDLYRMGQTEWC